MIIIIYKDHHMMIIFWRRIAWLSEMYGLFSLNRHILELNMRCHACDSGRTEEEEENGKWSSILGDQKLQYKIVKISE